MNQCTGRSERRLLQRYGEPGASPHRTVVARQNALGLVARQQQDFVERIVARDFIDQRVEERPAADRQHRFRRRLRPLAKPGAEAADQNDSLSQHRRVLDDAAQHVADGDMHFLNTVGARCRHLDQDIAQIVHAPAIGAGHSDGDDPHRACGLDGGDDIGAVAAG